MDLLDKLASLKLKQPKGLKKFIWEETNYRVNPCCTYGCVETMEKWRDTWILRVFAYPVPSKKKRTKDEIITHEVQRKILGYKEYLSSANVYNTTMGGRRILWDRPVVFWKAKKNWEFEGHQMYDKEAVIDDLGLKYSCWDLYCENTPWYKRLRFIDYLTMYVKEPRIERLVKLGLSEYLTGLRYLDLNKRKIYDVFKIDKKWEFVIGNLPMKDILILRKSDKLGIKNLDDLKLYNDLFAPTSGWDVNERIKKYTTLKGLSKYAESGQIESVQGFSDYRDYLRFAEKLGYDLTRNKVIYPSDLKNAHDDALKEWVRLEDLRFAEMQKKSKEGIMLQYKKLRKHRYRALGLIINPVKTLDELINESSKLRHCVRSYAEDVAKGRTEILLIRREDEPEKPFVTVEVQNKSIIQARGKNNCSPPDEVKEFLRLWGKKNKIACSY